MVKQETETEEKPKSEKVQAIAVFNQMPDELKTAIDTFVGNMKTATDIAKKVIELALKHNYGKEQVEMVIRAKMTAAGMKIPNLKALLDIKKESVPSGEIEEDAEEAAEEEVSSSPSVLIPLSGPDGINKNDIISNLKKATQHIKVFFSKEDYSFIQIEIS